jgi:hypothetical protein
MTTLQLSIEKVARRFYVVGNSYPIKDALKSAGCAFDFERKQWWIGAAKVAAVEQLVQDYQNGVATLPVQDLTTSNVYGKVRYKNRTYYVIARGEEKLRLTVLDGSVDFWATSTECEWAKRYEPRTINYGRGRSTEKWQTLGEIRRFVERQSNPATARVQCPECDSWFDAGSKCRECGGC